MKTLTPYEHLVQAVTDCLEFLEEARPRGSSKHVARLRRSLKISRIDSTMWSSLEDLSRDIKRALARRLDDDHVEERLLDVAEVALGALETVERAFDAIPATRGPAAGPDRDEDRWHAAPTYADGSGLQAVGCEAESQTECLLMGYTRLPNMMEFADKSDPLVGH